jgi:hypothetical protein
LNKILESNFGLIYNLFKITGKYRCFFAQLPKNTITGKNKTENHFSHYQRSQVDISSYTRLNISTSFNCEKINKLPVKVNLEESACNILLNLFGLVWTAARANSAEPV